MIYLVMSFIKKRKADASVVAKKCLSNSQTVTLTKDEALIAYEAIYYYIRKL